MGNWSMTIVGVGCHHNHGRDEKWRKENDADKQFEEFVKALEKSGHSIGHASFVYGGAIPGTETTKLNK